MSGRTADRCTLAIVGSPRSRSRRAPRRWRRNRSRRYHVQGNVYMLVGAGANVAVQIGDDGVLVVDTGARATREAVLAAIRRLSDGPIRWIVNTQRATLDHTGGNETISQAGMTVNGNPGRDHLARERARAHDGGRIGP